MKTVERAKRRARITTAAQDVAQWRRSSTVCEDHVVAAEQIAAELEARYSGSDLDLLAKRAGFGRPEKASRNSGSWLALVEARGEC